MTFTKFALAAAAFVTLSPAIVNASPEKNSVKACAHAFASSIASPGAPVPGYKLDYKTSFSGSMVSDFYPSEYTYDLEAHDPKTGATIARARCSADDRGTVTDITAVPLDAKMAAR